MNARIALRWARRAALLAVLTLFVISEFGLLILGKGRWLSDFNGVLSASGALSYVHYQTTGIEQPQSWDQRFIWFNDPQLQSVGGWFNWKALGFNAVSRNNPEFAYRKSPNDPTIIKQPAFSVFAVQVPYWPLLLMLSIPELMLIWQYARKRVCESARPRNTSAAATDDSLIVADLPCVHCAYNLRMQPRNALCPECGLAIANTLSLNAELARSRPGWLKSLALGNALLLAVRVVLLAVYAELFSHEFDAIFPTAITAGVLYVVGIYLLTRPEHPFFETPQRKHAVRRQRIAAMFLLFFLAVGAWAQYSFTWRHSGILGIFESVGYGYFRATTLELLLYAWLIFCVLVVLEYFYLVRLAGRLLDRFMTEHCKIAGIGAAIGGVIVIFIVRSIATDRIPWDFVPLILTCAVVIIWQLFVLWAGFMNAYLAVRFLQQAWIAEQRWLRQSEGATIETAP